MPICRLLELPLSVSKFQKPPPVNKTKVPVSQPKATVPQSGETAMAWLESPKPPGLGKSGSDDGSGVPARPPSRTLSQTRERSAANRSRHRLRPVVDPLGARGRRDLGPPQAAVASH